MNNYLLPTNHTLLLIRSCNKQRHVPAIKITMYGTFARASDIIELHWEHSAISPFIAAIDRILSLLSTLSQPHSIVIASEHHGGELAPYLNQRRKSAARMRWCCKEKFSACVSQVAAGTRARKSKVSLEYFLRYWAPANGTFFCFFYRHILFLISNAIFEIRKHFLIFNVFLWTMFITMPYEVRSITSLVVSSYEFGRIATTCWFHTIICLYRYVLRSISSRKRNITFWLVS